jgi:hypothetical protein
MPSYDFSESDRAAGLGWRTYTRSEISALYAAHRRGDYVGKEIQWWRQEIDIVKAAAEGRVIGAVTRFDK